MLHGDRTGIPRRNMRSTAWPGLAAAFLALSLQTTVAAEQAGRTTQTSQIARLASKSLLLGATLAGERVVAVGERGHVLLSDDRGTTWRQVVVPTRVTLTAVHFPTPTDGWAVGHDAVILHSDDGGESWTRQYADPDLESPLLDVWLVNAERGFAVGAYGLFLETQDAGVSWVSRTISDRDVHYNTITATRDGNLYVAGERGAVFRSVDGGDSWQEIESADQGSVFGSLGLPDGGLLLFGLQGRVFWSEDGGESWHRASTGTDSSLMGGTATAAGDVVLGGINGVVLVSSDLGRSFELTRRTDRQAVSAAAAPPGGGLLLFGAFGAADAGELLSAGGPRTPGVDQP